MYVCALDENGIIISDVATTELRTEEAGNASYLTFTFSVTNIKASEATISYTPSDATCLYYSGLASGAETGESVKEEILKTAEMLINSGICSDFKDFMRGRGGRGNRSYTPTLQAGTEYRPYAIGIYENGEFATDVIFGESFTTSSFEFGSNVTIDVSCEKYFNGDELKRLDFYKYGNYAGAAAAPLKVTVDGDEETYYFTAFIGAEYADTEQWPDERFISSIILWGREKGDKILHSFRWDHDIVMVAVAKGKDGKYSNISRKLIHCTKEGASPVSEFDEDTMY